jgi:hypothetical protein
VRDLYGYNDLDTVMQHSTILQIYPLLTIKMFITQILIAQDGDDGVYVADYTCEFNVSYMAYNGTWYCNFTVNDTRYM